MNKLVLTFVFITIFAPVEGFKLQLKADFPTFKNAVAAGLAGIFTATSFNVPHAAALTKAETNQLRYLQVKGSGLANRCPDVNGDGVIAISGGKTYKITDLCIEPTSFQVEEETVTKKGDLNKDFVNTKLLTRQSYTLDGISGVMKNENGKIVFSEKDGFDYAAVTIQTPGGERVPMIFSVKELVAVGTGDKIQPGFEMGGSFTVPSYRTGLFMDPKGRGTTTGYDTAHALPALQTSIDGDQRLFNENNKRFDVLKGDIEFSVTTVDDVDQEFAGVFVSNQPGDTDMGAHVPKTVLLKGIFYGHVEEAS